MFINFNYDVLLWHDIVICYSEIIKCCWEFLLSIASVFWYSEMWIAIVNCYCELLLWNVIMNYYDKGRIMLGETKPYNETKLYIKCYNEQLQKGKDNIRGNKRAWWKGRIMWGKRNVNWNKTQCETKANKKKNKKKGNIVQCLSELLSQFTKKQKYRTLCSV